MKPITRLIAILVAFSWFIQFGIFDTISYAIDESSRTASETQLDPNRPDGGDGDSSTAPAATQTQLPGETDNPPFAGAPVQSPLSAAELVTVKSIQILYRDGTPITGDDKISADENIMIRYDFSVAEGAKSGDTVVFPLPDAIRIDTAQGTGPISVPLIEADGSEGDIIAYVALSTDPQQLVITFTDIVDQLDDIDQAFFAFAGEINGDDLDDSGEQTIVFEVPGNSIEIKLNFGTLVLEIDKELSSQYQENGEYYLVWQIDANPQEAKLYDLTILDTLPEGLVLENYQFEGGQKDTPPAGWTADTAGNPVKFFHSGAIEDSVAISLTTRVADLSKFFSAQGQQFLIENTVEAQANDSKGTPLDPETAEAAATIETEWMQKKGVVSKDDAYVIEWTVLLNTDNLNLKNVKLYDTIPDGLDLLTGTIQIKAQDGSKTLTPYTDVPITSTAGKGGTTYEFDFGTIDRCYVVTYETRVTDTIGENKDNTYTNSAYFTWSLDGIGGQDSPHVQEAVKVANEMLEKTGVRYYPKRHYTEWKITVNGSKNPISETVTITDNLNVNGQQQSYIQDSLKITIQARGQSAQEVKSGYTFTDNGDGTFKIVFDAGMLDEKTAVITFRASLDDLEFLAQNGASNRYYYNEATMVVGDSDPLSVTARQFITTRVLEKSLSSYDRDSQTFEWELTVNSNRLSGLGDVTVTDTLPERTTFAGLDVYEGDLVTGSTSDTIQRGALVNPSTYQVDSSGGAVTISFAGADLDGKTRIILLRTAIDDEFFSQNNDLTPFRNTANITMENVKNTVEPATSTGYASSSVVEKKGQFDADEGTILWEVMVNGESLDWELDGATLSDTLQTGLALDLDTVRLDQYAIDPVSGSPVLQQNIPLDINTSVSYDLSSNEFRFTFPDVLPGYAYKLTFATDVLESGIYDNQITFAGVASIKEDSKYSVTADLSESSAGATANRKGRISLTKADAHDSSRLLAGAVFELRRGDGVVLETGTTDPNGHIAFGTWLKYDTDYTLHEIQAPEGYTPSEESIPVKLVKGEAATLSYQALNQRITGKVAVAKTDPDGNPLAGVEFTLYDADGALVTGLQNPAVTSADGSVVFDALPYGSYSLVESAAPDNVVLDDTPIPVEVTTQGQTITLSLVNQLKEEPAPNPDPDPDPDPDPKPDPDPDPDPDPKPDPDPDPDPDPKPDPKPDPDPKPVVPGTPGGSGGGSSPDPDKNTGNKDRDRDKNRDKDKKPNVGTGGSSGTGTATPGEEDPDTDDTYYHYNPNTGR